MILQYFDIVVGRMWGVTIDYAPVVVIPVQVDEAVYASNFFE